MFNVRKWSVQSAIFIIICVAYFTFSAVTSRMSFEQYTKSLYQATSSINDNKNVVSTSISNEDKYSGINCCSDSYWDALVDSEILTGTQIMEYFMWTNSSSCRLAHDFGGTMLGNPSGKDGQKAVCIDPQVAPQGKNCLVYSFGISSEWSFDEDMEEYGCEVFAFDPSMKMNPHDHTSGIHFYNWGLSDQDEIVTQDNETEWQMYSLSSVYDKLSARHGPKVIDYLKMDIEGSEWKVLPNMLMTGMLSNVRQLGLEFHLPSNFAVEGFRELIKLVRAVERTGFVRFDSKYNPWFISDFTSLQLRQSAGYEIAWYNSKLLHHQTF